jgi:hypothetical protein
MEVQLTRGNSKNLYIEDLPAGLELEVFISDENTHDAEPVASAVEADVTYGTFDIPPEGRKPARLGITCYKAAFSGAGIAAHAAAAGQFIIFRAAPDINKFATLLVHDAEPIAPAL